MKTLLKLAGIILILSVIAAAGAYVWFRHHVSSLEKSGREFAESAVASIGSGWELTVFVDLSSGSLMQKIPADRLTGILQMYSSQFGSFKKIKELKGKVINTVSKYKISSYGKFEGEAEYEKQSAKVRLEVSREGEAWKVTDFDAVSLEEAAEEKNPDLLYKKAKDCLDGYYGDGRLLFQAQRYAEYMLRVSTSDARAYTILAGVVRRMGYINANNYEPEYIAKSHELLDTATRLNPAFFDAYISRSVTYQCQSEYEKASEALKTAEELNLSSMRVKLEKAIIAVAVKRNDEALVLAREVVDSPATEINDKARAYEALQKIYKHTEQYGLAEKAYRDEIALFPDRPWPKTNFSNFLRMRKRYDEAIEYAKKALALMDYGMGRHILGEAYSEKGIELFWKDRRYKEAGDYFLKAVDEDPGNYKAYYGLGNYYMTINPPDREKAVSSFKKCLELKPGYKKAVQCLKNLGQSFEYKEGGKEEETED